MRSRFRQFVPGTQQEEVGERYGDDFAGKHFESREHLGCGLCGEDLGPIYTRTTSDDGRYVHSGHWDERQVKRAQDGQFHGCIYWDYAAAVKYLERARSESAGRPIANNTRLIWGWEEPTSAALQRAHRVGRTTELAKRHIAIKLHQTEIIKLYANGDVEFDTGGWRRDGYGESPPTPTTLDRLRRCRPYNFFSFKIGSERIAAVYRRNPGEKAWAEDIGRAYIFSDGIRFTKRGRCTNGERITARQEKHSVEVRERRRMVNQVNGYMRRTANALRDGLPIGECDKCSEAMDAHARRVHLLEHLVTKTVSDVLVTNVAREWLGSMGDQGSVSSVMNWHRQGERLVMGGPDLPPIVASIVTKRMGKAMRDVLWTNVRS